MYPGLIAETTPNRVAYVLARSGEQVTYAELDAGSNQAARLMRELGLREGDAIFVLAPTPVEFLRLLAIGYGELGFADFDSPPSEEDEPDNINGDFQRWVSTTFNVTIPDIGAEIVFPSHKRHTDFQNWINARCG